MVIRNSWPPEPPFVGSSKKAIPTNGLCSGQIEVGDNCWSNGEDWAETEYFHLDPPSLRTNADIRSSQFSGVSATPLLGP
jgi:hypothetical protein